VRTAVAGCQSSPHKFRLTNSQAPITLSAIEIRLQWRAQENECQSNAGGTVSYPVHDFPPLNGFDVIASFRDHGLGTWR
jgi:hypothetical protein